MNCSTTKLTLAAMAFSAVLVCSFSEAQAEVRRGLLYDMFHFGGSYGTGGNCCTGDSCGSCEGYSCGTCAGCPPSCGLGMWIGSQLEAEKWRIREDVRFYRMHFYLHNQDKKKLLHRECSPFQDCYWGYYPTCWRTFPGEPQCPTCPHLGPDLMYYDEAGPMEPPAGDWNPEIYEPSPFESQLDSEFSDSLPETAPLPEEALPEPAPAPYVE